MELDREVGARSRRQAKDSAKRNANNLGPAGEDTNSKGKGKGKATEQFQDPPVPKQPRRTKHFNIQTYKFHVLGDYVSSIRQFGTTDSYSTEPVSWILLSIDILAYLSQGELEHRTPKGRYCRTDRRTFVRQLTQIERREARLRRIKQRQRQRWPATHAEAHDIAYNPQLQHHIGQSERLYDDFGQYLRNHKGDPAMTVSSSYDMLLVILRRCLGFSIWFERPYHRSPRSGKIGSS
jgi:hypothetical protein